MKNLFYLFLAFALYSCGTSEAEELDTETASTQSLSTILANNPEVKVGILETTTMAMQSSSIGKVVLPPAGHMQVHSKTTGTIEDIRVFTGDQVQKGAILCYLSNPELIEKQRNFLEAKAMLNQVKLQRVREEKLNTAEASSQKKLEEIRAEEQVLNARATGLSAELKLIGVNVAQLESNNEFQSRVPIYAAAAGRVHNIAVQPGQLVAPADLLFELTDASQMYIALNVPAKDASRIAIGQKVAFVVPQGQMNLEATVFKVDEVLNEMNGTLQVLCTINDATPANLKSGMQVQATIEMGGEELYGLSKASVIKEGEDYFGLYVVNDEIEKRVLKEVRVFGDFVSFKADSGTKMVTAGAYYLE